MLVLTREPNEVVVIGENIRICVLNVRGDKVRLGIDAPKALPVHREEIFDKVRTQQSEQVRAAEKLLTDRQKQIFGFIRDQILDGCPPSIREIQEQFDIASPNGVMCHIKALEKRGLITRVDGTTRCIRLVG